MRWFERVRDLRHPASRISAVGLGLLALAAPARADDTVDPTSGKLAVTVMDIAVSGGAVVLPVTRSLGSGDGAFGAAWSSNWDAHLAKSQSGKTLVLIQGGTTVNFAADGNQYKAEGGATITGISGGVALHRADLVTDYFDLEGRWTQRNYDNGYAAALKYDAGGKLTRIEGPLGSSLVFTRDNAGHVTRIANSNGDAATYTYQGDALVAVTQADGTQLRYTYDGNQIARIDGSTSGAETFTYDKSGRVTARQWADGTAEHWEYDDQARRTRLIAPGGAVTTWTLGDDGALEQIDPLGAKTVTRFDAQGRVATATSTDGKASHYSYDAQGRLSKIAEDGGITTDIAYVGTTALVSTIERSGGVKEALQYDRGGNLTQVTVNGETVAAMTYNDNGQIASRKIRGSPIERYEYDSSDWLAATVDANGQRTRYTRDPHGRVQSVTDPTGGVTTYAYDALGRIVSETTPTGGVWGNEYNQAGQLVARIAPDGTRETYQYDARGQRIAIIDASGRRAELAFDPAQALITQRNVDGTQHRHRLNELGQVSESRDGTGRVVRYEYGPTGLLAAEHRPDGQTLVYHYDQANRLIAVDDGLGGRTRYAWSGPFMIEMADASNAVTLFDNDAQGRVTAITDPLGGVRHIAYGEGDSPVEVKTAAGDDARYTYDAADRLIAVQDPAGGVTKFERDAAGRITAIGRPDGTVTRFTYDKAGGQITTADGSGRTVNYSYDPNGRLIGKKLPDGTSVAYRYGVGGTLTDADDKRTPVHRTLDAAGRVTAIEWRSINKSLSFAYDATGSITKLTGSAGQVVQYRYDDLHRLAAIVLPTGGEIGLSYDAAGRLAELRYPNGTTGIYRYGRTGAVDGLAWTGRSEVLAAWTYNHDAAGNVGTIARANAAPLIYGYDADGRLIEEKAGTTTTATYIYLPGGDRAKVTSGNQSVAYTYDKGRLASAGGESFAYGPLGEITERSSAAGKTSYQYDAEGHLLRASLPSGAVVSFAYDGNGTRVARSDAQGTTRYLSDDENLIEEIGPSGASVAFYIYGPGTDWPLAMIRGGQTYFYHADAQGNVALLTDGQGKVAARYETDAFGRLTAPPPPLANPFIFAGREYDAALGLYYFRARYYDASLGRFISADPMLGKLRDPATLNRYAYAVNAPTRFKDPTGLGTGFDPFTRYDGTQMEIRGFHNSPPPNMRIDFDYWRKQGFSRGQLLDLVNQARNNIVNNPEYVPGYGGKPPSGSQLDADAHWVVEQALQTKQLYEPDGTPTTRYVAQALNQPQAKPGWTSKAAVAVELPPGGAPSANPGGSSGSVARAIEPGPAPGASSSAGANNSVVGNAGSNPAAAASASSNSGSNSGISRLGDSLRPNASSIVSPANPSSGASAVDPNAAPMPNIFPAEPAPSGSKSPTLNLGQNPLSNRSNTGPLSPPSAGGSGGSAGNPNVVSIPNLNAAASGGNANPMPPAEPLPNPAPLKPRPPGNLLNGGAASSSTAEPGLGVKVAKAGAASAVAGGITAGINCALDGGNARECAVAAAKAAGKGLLAGLGTALLTAAAPAAAPVLTVAGGLKAGNTFINLGAKGLSVSLHGTIKEQTENSQAVLTTEDLYIADLRERIARIREFVGPAPAPAGSSASLRDVMTAIQDLEGKLNNLTTPKAGGVFSSADQLRRAADDLTQLCAKLSDNLGKINGATSSAAGTVKQIADLMAAQGEPPESTPQVTSAAKQVQGLQGTLTGAVALAAEPVPALVTEIKAAFQGLAGSNGQDTNAIKDQIARYDVLTNSLRSDLGQLNQMVSEFNDAKEQHSSEIIPLRAKVRHDVILGADDIPLYDAKSRMLNDLDPRIGNIADEAVALLKRADGNLKRWRNALGGDASSSNAKPFDIKTTCSIGPDIQSVTNAVAAAGTAVKDLGSHLDGLNGTFQRRKPALDKIEQIDHDALTKGPGLVAIFKKANQPDNASAAQAVIDRANQRQAKLPQEQAAVQQAVTSLGTIKTNVAGIISALGGGQ
jgi:RHS repeat-associated protein